jgi:predicted metallo-beta-lactamase superfamily hydrolase
MSDSIPDGNANSKIGRVVAVVIRETNKGFGASEVIS